MILVLLGTQNNSFHRLLEKKKKNIKDKTINEVKNESNTTQTEKVAINTSILNTTQPTNTAKTESQPVVEEKKVEEPKVVELHFSVPVQGEIAKDFSDSNLKEGQEIKIPKL